MEAFLRYLLALTYALIFSSLLSAHEKSFVAVSGGGTMVTPNSISVGFNAANNKFDIEAKGNKILHGTVLISSLAAGPVDPVTGVIFEADVRVDAVRVFADHPDVVWVHGTTQGFITFGTSPQYPFPGQTIALTPQNGEVIGAVTTWGRTNFLTVLENGNIPLPNFFSASENELISLVQGFSRILLTTGAAPGEICIETSSGNITIPHPY